MPRASKTIIQRLRENALSVTKLADQLEKEQLAEGHVEWAQTDTQHLAATAEKLSILFYTGEED